MAEVSKIAVGEGGFDFVEYKEACNAYFQGVNIGYAVVKNFITLNVVLVVAIGALATAEVKSDFSLPPQLIVTVIPFVGILFSLGLAAAVPHYWRHLRNCRDRCAAIERKYGGQLFNGLARVEDSGQAASLGLGAMIAVVALLWLLFAARGYLLRFIL